MSKYLILSVCLVAATVSVAASPQDAAQTSTAAPASVTINDVPDGGMPTFLRPETPEQRMARLGTAEDPGINPDLTKTYYRFGKPYQIHRYMRDWAIYTGGPDENSIRPFGPVNAYRELYQHNEKYTWVWQALVEEPAPAEDVMKSTQTERRWDQGDVNFFQMMRPEFSALMPADAGVVVRFAESSRGLPQDGSWRNSLAVADMNDDGYLDLVAPPQRAGGVAPSIFLGDGKGNWKYWAEVRWPHGTDYGSVAAADFNKDGHMDLVSAVHLRGIYVYLGDGKGNFVEATEGLPRDFGTRRVVVADVDRDGYQDLVAISEGPTAVNTSRASEQFKLRAYLNRKKALSWEMLPISDEFQRVSGDWVSVGDFNGDRYPDFAGGTIYYGSVDTLYLSGGPKKWNRVDPAAGTVVPFMSYYFASAAGRFGSKKTDDAIVSYARTWPGDLNPKLIPTPEAKQVVGLDRIQFTAKGPVRTPIIRWDSPYGITGVAAADFNGDGNLDIISTRSISAEKREVTLLLGDGKGKFKVATLEGMQLKPRATYDLKVADVNGDKRPDVIVMYEASGGTMISARDGAIQVFVNQGADRPAIASGK